jgi:hypothetical protein
VGGRRHFSVLKTKKNAIAHSLLEGFDELDTSAKHAADQA